MITSIVLLTSGTAVAQEIELTGDLTPEASQQRTETLCRSARALLDLKLELKQARRLYLRAIRTGADDARCAVDGLKQLAEIAAAEAAASADAKPHPIRKARALLAQGYSAEAEKEVTALLDRNPSAAIPRELQRDVRALATAEALAAEGYETEAQAKVREALAADPDSRIPVRLQQAERKPSWLRGAIGWLGQGLVAVAIIGALVFLALAIVRTAWSHLKRRIVSEPFVGGPEDIAQVVQAEVQRRFRSWSKGHSANRLSVAAGPDQKLWMPANVAGLVPQGNVIADFLTWVDQALPSMSWQVRGQLMPSEPERGVALALTVSRKFRDRILVDETLAEADFLKRPPGRERTADEKALAWQRLGLAGGALLLFTDRGHRRNDQSKRLGTEDWRAYAMATSADAYCEWDLDTARRLYLQAIARDPDYPDATFGLAVVELRQANGVPEALGEVERRLVGLIKDGKLDPGRDTLWYRAQFWRVVLRLQQRKSDEALKEAQTLFGPETRWWNAKPLAITGPTAVTTTPKALRTFLRDAFPNSVIPLAGALALNNTSAPEPLAENLRNKLGLVGGSVTGDRIADALAEDPKLWPKAAYGLAGYFALSPRDEWAECSLRHLKIALEYGGLNLAQQAWTDYMLRRLHEDPVNHELLRALVIAAGFTPPRKAASRARHVRTAGDAARTGKRSPPRDTVRSKP